MRTITVIIEYAKTSPALLEYLIGKNLLGWCGFHDINEDYFEFWVECREEDAANVERQLAAYV